MNRQQQQRHAAKASLQSALDANRELQKQIKLQLQQIYQRQAKNRQSAASCIETLHWIHQDGNTLTSRQGDKEDTANDVNIPRGVPKPKHVKALFGTPRIDETDEGAPRVWYKKQKQFQYDPKRRWNLEYFIDPLGSRPAETTDLAHRKRKRQADNFFHHTCPPWSKRELALLKRTVNTKRNNNQAMDWNQVVSDLQETQERNKVVEEDVPSAKRARTAKECELAHLSLASSKRLPKTVMHHVLEQVHKAKANNTTVDWMGVAQEINNANDDHVSAWQLFQEYQQKWKTAHAGPATWKASIEQDEILLRYMAMQGPQYVWDKSEAAHLGQRIFPTALPKQLIHRCMSQSLNPNMTLDSSWTLEEERKLVLCMKVYQHYPEPAIMAATHFYPHRVARQVTVKWDRSLCPQRNNRVAFSKEEDELLLTKGREGQLNFGEMARQEPLFQAKCRGHHQLYQRWQEIASPEEVAARRVQEQWRAAAVSPQDFVLQVQAKDLAEDDSSL